MTDFDKTLIEQAKQLRRWEYRKIGEFIAQAQTAEARSILMEIRATLYDLVQESI